MILHQPEMIITGHTYKGYPGFRKLLALLFNMTEVMPHEHSPGASNGDIKRRRVLVICGQTPAQSLAWAYHEGTFLAAVLYANWLGVSWAALQNQQISVYIYQAPCTL